MFDEEQKPKHNLKLLNTMQRDNMSDSTKDGSALPKSRKSLIDFPYVDDYVVAPYRVYFEVTTSEVTGRIKDSIWPFSKTPLFMDSHIDLYGPLWIYFSLNVFIAIFSNICSYIDEMALGRNEAHLLSLHKLYRCYTLLAVYFFVIPLALNIMFYLTISRYPGYARLLAIYGYSFSIYIPATILYLVPNDQFRWVLLSLAGCISLF